MAREIYRSHRSRIYACNRTQAKSTCCKSGGVHIHPTIFLIAAYDFGIGVGWNRPLLAIPPCIATALGFGGYHQKTVGSTLRFIVMMKRGMRPIRSILDIAMFNRIYVDVLNMCKQVPLITYLMLPISTLPYTSFASFYMNRR